MLEQLRRNSRNVIIWILFGIIIAAFVFTFGQQGGLQAGCGGASTSYALMVDGHEVPISSFRYGINTTQGRGRGDRAQAVLDQLLVRELLAQAAEQAGYRVTQDLANDHIRRGTFWILGTEQNGESYFLEKAFEGGDPNRPVWVLDFDRLNALVQGWGLPTVDHFIKEQQREILADTMRTTLMSSARASAEEARARFEYQNNTATIDAVVFKQSQYRSRMNLTEKQVAEYLAGHEQEVQTKYKEDERLYQGVSPEVRVRQIMFARAAAAAPEDSSEAPADPAREAADKTRAELAAGADFATLAAERSQDERYKTKGGDLGWRSLKNPSLGAQELTDALGKLEVGAISDVITTPRGYYILKVEDKREGNLTFDQVKLEIAEKMAAEQYSREAMRRDAQTAVDQGVLAGKKLEELFERRQEPKQQFDPSQLPPELLQQLTPEQLQQLLQQAAGDEQGSIAIETGNIPAQSGNAQPAAPAAGQPAHAAGAPAAPHPVVPAQPPAAGPQPTDVPRPQVQRIGPFQRDADNEITGIGKSEELTEAIFEQLAEGQVAPRAFEVGGDLVVVQMVARKTPDMSKFDDAEKERIIRAMASERGYSLYRSWVEERCRTLVTAGKVGVNQAFLSQLSNDPAQKFQYQACAYIE